MAKTRILASHVTPGLEYRIFKMKYMVHVEISSPKVWKELLKLGLDVDEWSKRNYGNKIYLLKPSK